MVRKGQTHRGRSSHSQARTSHFTCPHGCGGRQEVKFRMEELAKGINVRCRTCKNMFYVDTSGVHTERPAYRSE